MWSGGRSLWQRPWWQGHDGPVTAIQLPRPDSCLSGIPDHPRLRSGVTVVQRSPGCVQVGLQGEVLLLEQVPEHLVGMASRLDGRSTVADLLCREDSRWLPWLLTTLHQNHLLVDGPPEPAHPTWVRVLGHGPTVAAMLPLLLDAGVELSLVDLSGSSVTSRSPVRALAASLGSPRRVRVESRPSWDDPGADLTILATRTCEPDRVLTDRLLRASSAHLVIRHHPGTAIVGPLVDPGRSPCLRCSDLRRSRADPAWQMVALQLSRTEAPPDPLLATWAAATAAFQALTFLTSHRSDLLGGSVRLARDEGESYQRWPAHPDCGCQDPT